MHLHIRKYVLMKNCSLEHCCNSSWTCFQSYLCLFTSVLPFLLSSCHWSNTWDMQCHLLWKKELEKGSGRNFCPRNLFFFLSDVSWCLVQKVCTSIFFWHPCCCPSWRSHDFISPLSWIRVICKRARNAACFVAGNSVYPTQYPSSSTGWPSQGEPELNESKRLRWRQPCIKITITSLLTSCVSETLFMYLFSVIRTTPLSLEYETCSKK